MFVQHIYYHYFRNTKAVGYMMMRECFATMISVMMVMKRRIKRRKRMRGKGLFSGPGH